MAHCLHRPLLSSLSPICSRSEQRCFSQAVRLLAAPGRGAMAQMPPVRHPGGKSMKVRGKVEGGGGGGSMLQADLGLLPETYIHPLPKNQPSLFSAPSDFLELQWIRLKNKVLNRFQVEVYKWQMAKPRPKLRIGSMAPTAVGLHAQMYTAFADADIATIKQICTQGLRQSFLARIASRPRGERISWELIKMNRRPKVMSHRAATLGIDGLAIRQTVVRIDSRQKLSRYRPDGTLIEGSGKEKDILEYVVIQKMTVDGKEREWQVWGTTGETTLQQVREAKIQALQ